MHRERLFLLMGLAAIHAGGLSAQRVAPALRGNWTLDVATSTFGPDGTPSAGTIRWTEHGVLRRPFGPGVANDWTRITERLGPLDHRRPFGLTIVAADERAEDCEYCARASI